MHTGEPSMRLFIYYYYLYIIIIHTHVYAHGRAVYAMTDTEREVERVLSRDACA